MAHIKVTLRKKKCVSTNTLCHCVYYVPHTVHFCDSALRRRKILWSDANFEGSEGSMKSVSVERDTQTNLKRQLVNWGGEGGGGIKAVSLAP